MTLRRKSGQTPTESTSFSSSEAGLTLVELLITITILGILASASLPVVKLEVKREKERELRQDLWMMRDAIDAYKDMADKGGLLVKADSFNYPPDLQSLVDGVEVKEKKIRFLRSIPKDPMTGDTDWDLRANQDDADATSWGGQNVFDVHSKSTATALDGTKYNTW
jgi:general secretion pathway protein G